MTLPHPSDSQPAIPRVFVSHSHLDNAFCRPFVAHLRTALGLTDADAVFFDEQALHLGDAWLERIQHEVLRRPIFIVVLTPHAVVADYVRMETHLALRETITHQERRIFSLLAEPCDPNQLAPLLLNYQLADMVRKGYDAAFGELVSAIRAAAAGAPASPGLLPVPPSGTSASPPTSSAPAPAAPVDPVTALASQLLPRIEASSAARDWADVARKCEMLIRRARSAATPAVYRMQGRALLEERDAAGARVAFDAALALDPGDVPTMQAAAQARVVAGQAAEALPLLEDAMTLAGSREQRVELLKDAVRAAHAAARRDALARYLAEGKRLAPADAFWEGEHPLPPDQFPPSLARLGFIAHARWDAEYIVPPLCDVPAGAFLMGSDKRRDAGAYDNELPQHSVTLPAFQIGKYPVTVAEYAGFVHAGQREPGNWRQQTQRLDHPVVSVSWQDAIAYAAWLARATGQPWRLPSEAEWEKAARGTDGRIYPWGDQWEQARANTSEGGKGGTTAVGGYPTGASPYGAQDMAGNVWEWTSSVFKPYPYRATDGSERADLTESRVLRGGSWNYDARLARAAYRNRGHPDLVFSIDGFRVVCAVPSS